MPAAGQVCRAKNGEMVLVLSGGRKPRAPRSHVDVFEPGAIGRSVDEIAHARALQASTRQWHSRRSGPSYWTYSPPEGQIIVYVLRHSLYEERGPAKRMGLVGGIVCHCPQCEVNEARLARDRKARARRQQRRTGREQAIATRWAGSKACPRCGCTPARPCVVVHPDGKGEGTCVPAGIFDQPTCSECVGKKIRKP